VLKRAFKYLFLLVAATALAWLVIYLAGWSVPIGFMRDSLLARLNQELAPVRVAIEGPISLRPTLNPSVNFSDIKLTWPARQPGRRPWATVGRASIRASLASLWHGRLDLERVALHDLHLPVGPPREDHQRAVLRLPEVSGRLIFSEGQVRLEDLALRLERGALLGRMLLDPKLNPPKLVLHLESTLLDVDGLARLVALEKQDRAEAKSDLGQGTALDLMMEDLAKSVQGELTLKAEKISWRGRDAGRGELHISSRDRRLAVERLNVELLGGRISARNTFWPLENGLGAELELEVHNFPYGFLAHQMSEASLGNRGVFSLRLSMTSQAPRGTPLLDRANGTLQVGVWPLDLRAEAYDLWAANLMFALLGSLASKTESKVNCAVGQFVMENGVMTSKELIIDTSKVRVSGKGRIDFPARNFEVRLQPRAKKAAFFSLETPIHIKGTFDQASAGVGPVGLVGSVINFATSPVFAPLRRLADIIMPEKAPNVCRAPLSWPPPAEKAR